MSFKALTVLAIAGGLAFASGPAVAPAAAHGGRRHHATHDEARQRSRDHHAAQTDEQSKHPESNDESSRECGSGSVSDQDREFLMTSIEGDHFEIAGGQMATERGVDPSTKELGARLVSDHSTSLADATELAQKFGVPVPATMSEKQQEELAQVGAEQGIRFDDEYAELEVSDHQQDIADASKEVTDGCNAEVRDNARTEIPILQTHLDMSQHVHEVIEARLSNDNDESNDESSRECGSGSVSDQDREFLMTSIEGDHFEIAGGQMATER